jgi:hypothetical protein
MGDLKYASWESASGTWNIQTVDSDGDTGYWPSLALDSAGNPHISYFLHIVASGDLKYASWESVSGTWNIQTVDSDRNVEAKTSLALDSAGNPHISYHDNTGVGGNLMYAYWEAHPIVYVSPEGSDANNGLTPNNPKRTIQNALDTVEAGGEVRVMPGSYTLEVSEYHDSYNMISWPNKQDITLKLTFEADGTPGPATIDAQGVGRIINVLYSVNITIEGLTLRNGNWDANNGVGISLGNSWINLYLYDVVLRGCIANMGGSGAGIFADPSDNIFAKNCIFTDNHADLSGGFAFNGSWEVINCTFTSNESISNYGGVVSSATWKSTNSIYWANSAPMHTGSPVFYNMATAEVFYSDIQTDDYVFAGDHNISKDPLFIDKESGNYHLKPYSPCVDFGTIEGAPSLDIDGNPRPYPATNVDMGVYEYQGAKMSAYYVSPGGSDETGTGTIEAPLRTIQRGLDYLSINGGEIWVMPGVYTLEVSEYADGYTMISWPDKQDITLILTTDALGNSGPATIDAQGVGRIINVPYSVNITIEGLTLQNGNWNGESGVGIKLAGGVNLDLYDVVITGCTADSGGSGAGIYCADQMDHIVAKNCIFTNNHANGGNGGAIYADGATVIINDSTFSGNSADWGGVAYRGTWEVTNGTFSGNSASIGGIAYQGTWEVTNCSFSGNSSNWGGVADGGPSYSSVWEVTNSTFSGNSADFGGVAYRSMWTVINSTFNGNSASTFGGVACDSTWAVINSIFAGGSDSKFDNVNGTMGHSNVANGDWADFITVECIANDPLFLNALGGDLHLDKGSPCIDGGTWETGVPSSDADGDPRPHGFGADIGAYEFQGQSIRVIQPNDGESLTPDTTYKVMWESTPETTTNVIVRLSTNEGLTWDTLVTEEIRSHPTGMSTYEWTVPDLLSNECMIYIEVSGEATGAWNYDTSDSTFEITSVTPSLLPTVYVSPEGSDANDGATPDTPKRTIQNALGTVEAGGKVMMLPGVYSDPGDYNISWPNKDNITLIASTGATLPVTIDAVYNGRIISVEAAVSLTIEGLTMQNGYTDSLGGAGIYIGSPGVNLWLKDVVIKNCSSEIMSLSSGAVYCWDNTVNIFAENCAFIGNYALGEGGVTCLGSWNANNCIFTGNRSDQNAGAIWGGIWKADHCIFSENTAPAGSGGVVYMGNFEASNCIFSGNYASSGGVGYFNNSAVGGMTATNCAFVRNSAVSGGVGDGNGWPFSNWWWNIYNCDFIGNTAEVSGGVANDGCWNVFNSILRDNYAPSYPLFNNVGGYYKSFAVYYSDVQSGWGGPGNIEKDPLFISTIEGYGFLRLGPNSPCIDTASLEEAPPDDLAGNIRPHGFGNDMGIYEFQGPSVSIESPISGEVLVSGSNYDITWQATDEIWGIAENSVTIEYSLDNGGSWEHITTEAYAGLNGSYTWHIPPSIAATDKLLIKVLLTNASSDALSNYDVSDGPASIILSAVYVSPGGSDETGTGTVELPFRTIQKGLDFVAPGGEVRLMPGTHTIEAGQYVSGSMVNWPDKADITLKLTFEADGTIGPATIDAQNLGRMISVEAAVNLTIEGITMQNGKLSDNNGGGVKLAAGADLWLKGVVISNCSLEGDHYGGAVFASGASVFARDCFFNNNHANNGGVVCSEFGGTWESFNCVFNGNSAATFGGVAYCGTWKAVNCTFYGNDAMSGGGYYGGSVAAGGVWTGINLNIWGNNSSASLFCRVMAGVYELYPIDISGITYSNIQPYADWPANTGNISTEPYFVSTDETDALHFLRLGQGSRCIDSGSTVGYPPVDLAGNNRPRGLGVDMGAYEFQGPSVAVRYPNGWNTFNIGDTIAITWEAADQCGMRTAPPPIYIYYSTDSGESWTFITNEANSGTYNWTIPSIVSTSYLISIDAFNSIGESNYDRSDDLFSVLMPVVYVSPNGSDDTGTGTVEAPFKTIQKGLTLVAASGEVRVMPGVYTGEAEEWLDGVLVDWPNKPDLTLKLTFEADGTRGPATIDAQEQGVAFLVYTVSPDINLTIEGITIQNGKSDWGGGLYLAQISNVSLIDVMFDGCAALYNGGAVYSDNSSVNAYDCVFKNNNAGNGGVAFGGTWIAKNCIFAGNHAVANGGVCFGSNSYDGSWSVENCTFYNNTAVSGGVAAKGYYALSWFDKNSIYYKNAAPNFPLFYYIDPTLDITYSRVQSDDYVPGTGNTSAEPKFVSTDEASSSFLYLDSGSPCIDTASKEAPLYDLAGKSRPHGFGNDMGVYEFQGPSVSVESPNGGETLVGDQIWPVKWLISGEVSGDVVVRLSTDNGLTWGTEVTREAAKQGESIYNWTVPYLIKTQCRISVEAQGNGYYGTDSSNGTFSILLPLVYVSPSGSDDAGTGTIEAPFKTINKGLTSVAPSGEVRLMQGLYDVAGDYNVTWPNKNNITLIASPGATGLVTIDANNASGSRAFYISILTGINLTIEGITIQNTYNSIGAGIWVNKLSNIWLNNVIFKSCKTYTGGPTSFGYGGVVYSNLSNNYIYAKNCIFYASYAYRGGGVAYQGYWTATNCTFFKNVCSSGSIGYSCASWTAVNSIFWDNGASLFAGVTPTITYSDAPAGYTGQGNITADPKFASIISTEANFLCPGAGSPCMDIASKDAPPLDLARNTRPQGFGNDMGAYEFQGPSISVEYPNGGETFAWDEPRTIKWLISGEGLSGDVYVMLSTDNGASWTEITHEAAVTGEMTYDWLVPGIVSSQCLISVEAAANGVGNYDTSNGNFMIRNPYIIYVSPTGSDEAPADGTYGKPFRTIQKGLNVVVASGKVYAMPGVYTIEAGSYVNRSMVSWPNKANISLLLTTEANGTAGPATIDAQNIGRFITLEAAVNLTIEGITIRNGTAEGTTGGGCIFFPALAKLWLKDVVIRNCTGEGGATGKGGVFSSFGVNMYTVNAQNCSFIGNRASGFGGVASRGTFEVTSCTFESNSAGTSGGVFATSNVYPNNCTFNNNDASSGGVVYAGAATSVFNGIDCSFTSNTATTGAVANTQASSPLTVTNCAFSSNNARSSGGVASSGTWRVFNCTFYNNSAALFGGVSNTGTWYVYNSTFNKNSANQGGVAFGGTWSKIINSIFSENTASTSPVFSGITAVTSIIYSDIQPYSGWPFSGNGNISAEPSFSSTSESDALKFLRLGAGSPCIDSASSEIASGSDKGGNIRPRGFGNDIGAYEFQGPSISVEYPNGGEMFTPGDPLQIKWLISGEGLSGDVYVMLSSNNGASWIEITHEAAVAGKMTYDWLVPGIGSSHCLISVEAAANGVGNYDISNATFYILSSVIYVAPWGSDEYPDGDGSFDKPFRTVGKGLDAVASGGEVRLMDGIFTTEAGSFINNSMAIWPNRPDITLIASPGATDVTIDAQGWGRCISLESAVNLTIEGITIQNGSIEGQGGAIYLQSGSDLWLNDVVVQCCSAEGATIGLGGAVYSPDTSTNIFAQDCIFKGNHAYAGGVAYSGTWEAARCKFINNKSTAMAGVARLSDFTAENCEFSRNYAPNGGVFNQCNPATLRDCTVYNNNATNGGVFYGNVGYPSNCINTIVWNNSSVYYFGNNTAYYCDIQKNSWIPGTGNISIEPNFVSTDETDDINYLRLNGGSPCIDAGSPEAPSLDLDTKTRPYGFGNDMGAYEFQGPSVRVIQPNGGEIVTAEALYNIIFNVSPEADDINIRVSTDEGNTWNLITDEGTYSGISTYEWKPSSILVSTECLISIEARDPISGIWNYDTSDAKFRIVDLTPPSVTLEAPIGGEIIKGGDIFDIVWSAIDNSTLNEDLIVSIYFTSGEVWELIATTNENSSGVGTFEWTTPSAWSSNEVRVKIEVSDEAGNIGTAESGLFTIDSFAPQVTVTAPKTGGIITKAAPYTITWAATDEIMLTPEAFTIWYSTDEGANWELITSEVSSLESSYQWNVPDILTDEAMVSIEAKDGAGHFGYGISGKFAISYPQLLSSEVWVSWTTGSNTLGAGTVDKPYKTISFAMTKVATDGAIYAFGDTYYEKGIVWSAYDNVTLKSSMETTVCTIDAQLAGRCISVEAAVHLTIEGFTLKRGRAPIGKDGGGIYLASGSALHLINDTFVSCEASSGGNGGAIMSDGSTVRAEDCRFISNAAIGGGVSYYGIWNTINCIFSGNSGSTAGGGVAEGGTWESTNCVFIKNSGGSSGGVENGTSSWKSSNSIYWYNTATNNKVFGSSSRDVKYSDIQNDGWPASGLTNCLSIEPRFVSTDEYSSGFVRLDSGSPCIDTASTEAPSPDLAGNPRPHGFGNDMGAYEFQGPSISVESPNGGESLTAEAYWPIKWIISGEVTGDVVVRLSIDNGITWPIEITRETAVSGKSTYSWLVPSIAAHPCRISVEAQFNELSGIDISNNPFYIYLPVVYISGSSGDDYNGTGTEEAPFETINQGLAWVIPGGTIKVDSAVYNERLTWPKKNNLTLTKWHAADVPTLDAGLFDRNIAVSSPLNITIEGFTIQRGCAYDKEGSVISLEAGSKLYLINTNITKCLAYMGSAGGAIRAEGSSVYALNCIFSSNEGANSAVALYGSWEAINCIFYDNNAGTGAPAVAKNADFIAKNCVFYGNKASACTVFWNGGGDPNVWITTNCIFWGNIATSGFSSVEYGGTFIPTNCLIQPDDFTPGTGNISSEPRFVDVADRNFHLNMGSPCIDSGTSAGVYSSDLDGNTRPHGFESDMGAYEFQGPSIRVIWPNGGEQLTAEASNQLIWEISGEGSVSDVHVWLSTNEGLTWDTPITDEPRQMGVTTTEWKCTSGMISTECLISIEVSDGSGIWNYDISDAIFEIKDMTVPIVTIEAPVTGEIIAGGSTYSIIWTATDDITSNEALVINIYYTSGEGWASIITTFESSTGIGTYEWEVPSAWSSSEVKIKIEAVDATGNVGTAESGKFTIDSFAPQVTVIDPKAGEFVIKAMPYTITWAATDEIMLTPEAFTIWYSSDEGISWNLIISGISSLEISYSWNVPDIVTDEAMISIEAKDKAGHDGYGISGIFSIENPPIVTVEAPNGGEIIPAGSTYQVMWDVSPKAEEVYVWLSTNEGVTWDTLVTTESWPHTGLCTYEWTPTADLASTECLISVEAKLDGVQADDTSTATFEIWDTIANPLIVTVEAPNGGEKITADATTKVMWDVSPKAEYIQVWLSTNEGVTWDTIVTQESWMHTGLCTYEWTPTADLVSKECLISVEAKLDGVLADDTSYATFEIMSAFIGSVYDIMISRQDDAPGSIINLQWKTTPDALSVDIYTMTGTFETDAVAWTLSPAFTDVSAHQIFDGGQVRNGINKWYKIVPHDVALTDDMLTQEVLGKFDLVLPEGLNLVSLPLMSGTGSIQDIIGASLHGEDETEQYPDFSDIVSVWDASTGTFTSAYLNMEAGSPLYGKWCDVMSGYWGTPVESTIQISSSEGFWIQVQPGHGTQNVTIAGKIPSSDQRISISATALNLIGSNYPVRVSLQDSGLNLYAHGEDETEQYPDFSDIVSVWDASTGTFTSAYLNMEAGSPLYGKWCDLMSGYWGTPVESTIVFEPGKGFWIQTVDGGYEWVYPKPY